MTGDPIVMAALRTGVSVPAGVATTPGGGMDRTVRDILLACADGEGLALSYVSPLEVSHG